MVSKFKDIMDTEYPGKWQSGLSALKDDGPPDHNNYTGRIKMTDRKPLEGSLLRGIINPEIEVLTPKTIGIMQLDMLLVFILLRYMKQQHMD